MRTVLNNGEAVFVTIWVFPKIGVPCTPKWVVYFMEKPIKMHDCGGIYPYFWKHPYVTYVMIGFPD